MNLTGALISLALCGLSSAEAVWQQDGNRSLKLVDGDTVLVHFVLDGAPRDPHFAVLATKRGHNTVWVAPADHVWHYGLWFSWKKINGVNFWETNKATGEQEGRNAVLDPKILSEPDAATAIVRYRETSHPARDGDAVLEDQVEIRITRPQGELGVRVDWDVKTTALADVVLDRTPPPGSNERGEKNYGGYAGFSWRGPKEFQKLIYLDSENRKDIDIHLQHAEWVNVNGELSGENAGLLIVNHPSNPRHPSSWYVCHKPDANTFWYVNPAWLAPEPLQLAKGASFSHRYRVQLHDGSWTAETCRQAAAGLVK